MHIAESCTSVTQIALSGQQENGMQLEWKWVDPMNIQLTENQIQMAKKTNK